MQLLINKNLRIEAFYRWWIQKEAIVKVIGKGISCKLNNFSLDFLKEHIELNIPLYKGILSTHLIKDNLIFCLFITENNT